MTKVVFKKIYPELPQGSFAALPKTLHFYGENVGRLDELPDSLNGIHQIIIYNKGDAWMINLFDKSGQYVRDEGPSYNFYIPIFNVSSLRSFSFGHELQFMAERETKSYPDPDNKLFTITELSTEKNVVKLYLKDAATTPVKIELLNKTNELQSAYEYLEYQTDLAIDKSLFEKPRGINFNQQKSPTLTMADSIDYYSMNFYKNKNDTQLLIRLLYAISETDFLKDNKTAQLITLAFFGEAFKINPDVDWPGIIESVSRTYRPLFIEALNCAENGDSKYTSKTSPGQNDFYWSKYFASGNSAYVISIIDNIQYINERKDPYLYLTAGSAKWSLSSNAVRHPEIRKIIDNQIKIRGGMLQKELEDLLERKPNELKEEMVQILKSNKDNWEKIEK
ncbi:MAG: hypothetical protein KAH48_12355 [Chlorobi bacterium]|nr:hypothetical protein [Chlorobiota bacterium]